MRGRLTAQACADGVGANERLEMGGEKVGTSMGARMCADGVGAREKLEMGGEKHRCA